MGTMWVFREDISRFGGRLHDSWTRNEIDGVGDRSEILEHASLIFSDVDETW